MYRKMNSKQLLKVIEEVKQHKMEVEKLSKLMEEMTNAPKEEMGKRTPGERGMYEIQRLQEQDIPNRP